MRVRGSLAAERSEGEWRFFTSAMPIMIGWLEDMVRSVQCVCVCGGDAVGRGEVGKLGILGLHLCMGLERVMISLRK